MEKWQSLQFNLIILTNHYLERHILFTIYELFLKIFHSTSFTIHHFDDDSVSCRNMRIWIPFSSFFVCLQWECKFLILIYQPFPSIQTLEVVLIFAIFTGIQLIFLALSFVNVHEWKSSAITMDKTRKKFHIFYAFFFNFSFFLFWFFKLFFFYKNYIIAWLVKFILQT